MDTELPPLFRTFREGYRWDGVAHQPYKQDGSEPFTLEWRPAPDVAQHVGFRGIHVRHQRAWIAGVKDVEDGAVRDGRHDQFQDARQGRVVVE